jgi:hypothetical protein
MNNVFLFTPQAKLDVKQNLEYFVQRCRDECLAFGSDLNFEKNIWDISGTINLKGRSKAVRVIFSNYIAAKNGREIPTMSAPFLPFAKAYFRYAFSLRPTTAWNNRLVALRAIDHVLCLRGCDELVIDINHDILDEARNLILSGYSLTVAAKVASEIEAISDFLIESGFIQLRTRWLKNFSRPSTIEDRVGKDADKAREEKLPSVRAIEAMAHLFRNASAPDELYLGSTLALLHTTPQRINETVRLTVNCEVEEPDLNKQVQYGIRLPSSKGFQNTVRWIVPSMVNLAKRAIHNLKTVSSEARKIAKWYEDNPTKIYLRDELTNLRLRNYLSPIEVSQVLYGISDEKIARTWCISQKISKRDGLYAFDEIEKSVIAKLPKNFPYAQPDILYSDSLFVCRRFELDAKLTTYACLIDYVTSDQISSRIGNSGSVVSTVFERFRLTEDDGSPISIRSHQMRHYLNTLAQSNGISQIDIALWSGRADVHQNKSYDHVTSDALLSKARDLAIHKKSDIFGGDLNVKKVRVVARRDDVTGQLKTKTAHITDYGMCTHEFSSSPCQIHFDCLNCNELVCIKGDSVKLENILRLRSEIELLLVNAEDAEKDSVHGASRWVKHQRQTLDHCNKLISILTDETIPDGSVVKLSGIQPASRLEQAEFAREDTTNVALPVRRNKLLERIKRG